MDEIRFEDFCAQHDILIHFNDQLSTRIRGFCYYDGFSYHVIINSRFAAKQQQKTFFHEVIHIMENHFSCALDHQARCEQQTKELVKEMMEQFSDDDYRIHENI